MDHPSQPEQVYVNLGHNLTDEDNIQVAHKLSHVTSTQTPLEDFGSNEKIQSSGNALVSSLYRSSETSEPIFATRQDGSNIYASMNSQGSNISSSVEISTDVQVSSGSKDHQLPDDMLMVSSIHTPNKKKNEPSYRISAKNSKAGKRSRSEICDKRCKDLSTDSAQNMNYDIASDINTTCRTAFHSSSLDGNNHSETLSNNKEKRICEKTRFTSGENTASKTSSTEIYKNNNAPSEILNSVASKSTNFRCVDDVLAKPGPSGLNSNDNALNVSENAIQSWNQLEMPSIKKRKDKALTCNVCKSKISEHAPISGEKVIYECCICMYRSCEQADLQLHSDTHLPKKTCNICEKEHTEGNSHVGEHTCIVCRENCISEIFQCKTGLNEHILEHEDYFKKHCWVCSKNIDDHFNAEEEKPYICCICPWRSNQREDFKRHKERHRPKIFCRICKEEYHTEQKDWHGSEFMCKLCKKPFGCQTMLADHNLDHREHFDVKCRICDKEIENYHKFGTAIIVFKCCKCVACYGRVHQLQDHLYIHTDLNIFKCDKCGERFKQKRALSSHSRPCLVVPYRCERCPARFPSNFFLDLHCSVKHKEA